MAVHRHLQTTFDNMTTYALNRSRQTSPEAAT
jgi:hypothetical protein